MSTYSDRQELFNDLCNALDLFMATCKGSPLPASLTVAINVLQSVQTYVTVDLGPPDEASCGPVGRPAVSQIPDNDCSGYPPKP